MGPSIHVAIDAIRYRKSEGTLLPNFRIDIASGELLSIVGPSGCGKSTLLKVLLGSFQNSEIGSLVGEVTYGDSTIEALVRDGRVSFVPQHSSLLPHMTVAENVRLPFLLNPGISIRESESNWLGLLDDAGLGNIASQVPDQLSGGMQSRVMLVRAFATNPRLLLLDEPFSMLDYGWRFKLYALLHRLRKEHRPTTVLVSHDLEEAILWADKLLVLGADGEIKLVPTLEPMDWNDLSLERLHERYANHLPLVKEIRTMLVQ